MGAELSLSAEKKIENTSESCTLQNQSALEEGEILSDDECIMIETKPVTIVLDDDSCMQSENATVSYATSTPCEGTAPSAAEQENGALFFHDTSRIPWYEINKLIEETPTSSRNRNDKNIKQKNKTTQLLSSNASQIIVIDDSIIDTPDKAILHNNNADDSVMFVSETIGDPSFISIPKEASKKSKATTENERKKARPCLLDNSTLFTRREKTQLASYNSNLYNPHAGSLEKTGKRTVIIDGSNVAFHHSRNKMFSVEGLKIAVEYFEKIGHNVKAVVPQYRLKWGKSSNQTLLEELRDNGQVVVTPGKNLPNLQASSYDDRFILQLAVELDAAVISNDNYRDLIHENDAFKKIIENRVISYMWWGDIFVLAKDPYGRNGNSVEVILTRF